MTVEQMCGAHLSSTAATKQQKRSEKKSNEKRKDWTFTI
jgi:hypothetical protein